MNRKSVCVIYDDIAAWFDGARNKSLIEKSLLDFMLEKLPANASILDLGCGAGEPIAKYLIEAGCNLTGIDGSENMIAYCRQRFPKHTWIVQDMRRLDSPQSFDAIIVWDSFFHLSMDDQRKMFPLFAKHSNPDALLLFSSGSKESEFWSPMHGHQSAEMFHASLNSSEYEQLLATHGYSVLIHQEADKSCGGRTYWLAQKTS